MTRPGEAPQNKTQVVRNDMDCSNNRFRPIETIQKILISSTSRLIGEYGDEDVLITHAWQNFANASNVIRMEETPISRNGFVIVFETQPYEKAPGVS